MLALSFHSLLEGLTLGAAREARAVHLFLAILAHKAPLSERPKCATSINVPLLRVQSYVGRSPTSRKIAVAQGTLCGRRGGAGMEVARLVLPHRARLFRPAPVSRGRGERGAEHLSCTLKEFDLCTVQALAYV